MDLHPGEQILFEGHPSWRGVMSFYIKGVAVALVAGAIFWFASSEFHGVLAFAIIAGVAVLAGFVKRMATKYIISTERLHIRRGILSKRVQQTHIDRVQNVNTDQSPIDRLLRVGKVDFDTAGTDDSDFVFAGVADPDRVVAAVDSAKRAVAGQQPL
ncbi:MAG: PH domain-containing protein [Actinobacteria bacterium]|nr:PH domain-containing protein [Actinomycetota bacterium]